MRTAMFLAVAVALAGCVASSDGVATQAVAGPGGVTVAPPTIGGVAIAGELLVSWTPDPEASKYYVLQSAAGAPYTLVAALVGSPPASTLTVTNLAAGGYCYAVESAYPDGSASDPGAAGCGTATGSSAPPSGLRTIVVPVVPPTGGVIAATYAQVSGLESDPATGPVNLYVPLPLAIGETLATVRARVQDGGVTRVRPTLMQQVDGPPTQTLTVVMAGPISSGAAIEETLSFSPNIVAGAGRQYLVKFANVTGFMTTTIFRLEIDVGP